MVESVIAHPNDPNKKIRVFYLEVGQRFEMPDHYKDWALIGKNKHSGLGTIVSIGYKGITGKVKCDSCTATWLVDAPQEVIDSPKEK